MANQHDDLSAKLKNYKCFVEEAQGFDRIRPVNIIIGRNNSGKSALLDLLEFCTRRELKRMAEHGRPGKVPSIVLSSPIEDADLAVFSKNSSGGQILGNHHAYGQKWLGQRLTWEVLPDGNRRYVSVEALSDPDFRSLIKGQEVVNRKRHSLEGLTYVKLAAERDIVPEKRGRPSLDENGAGATNLLQSFINNVGLPSALVEETLLGELNSIFRPDAVFTDIVAQQHETEEWEVFLEENHKGRVPLSGSGSGIKTVLLVLCNFLLVPALAKQDLGQYVFAFEELENNLHPAIQRRLLLYIRDLVVETGSTVFMTTHSNVVIDLFGSDEDAQIVHVRHDGVSATAGRVQTYVDNRGVLDDLDVRASDLLQSNCIVWVEGPSDRIYFNRWIELWTQGELIEGAHYQCMFYGGRLLAHINAGPDERVGSIRVLTVNRNAIFLIDSDKKSPHGKLGKTKKRVIDEVEGVGGLAWATAGREIENYLPHQSLVDCLKVAKGVAPLARYDALDEFLEEVKRGEGERYLRSKVLFAERISPFLTCDGLGGTLDLSKRLDAVCERIRGWNGEAERISAE